MVSLRVRMYHISTYGLVLVPWRDPDTSDRMLYVVAGHFVNNNTQQYSKFPNAMRFWEPNFVRGLPWQMLLAQELLKATPWSWQFEGAICDKRFIPIETNTRAMEAPHLFLVKLDKFVTCLPR